MLTGIPEVTHNPYNLESRLTKCVQVALGKKAKIANIMATEEARQSLPKVPVCYTLSGMCRVRL